MVYTNKHTAQQVVPCVSVIIPTRNRAQYLLRALESIQRQRYAHDKYEIIVVDNGSTDDTRQVVEALSENGTKEIRYVYDERAGLHIGRHRGAEVARGDILLYGDDDIIADEYWAAEIARRYQNGRIGAIGGKIVPKWEAEPPPWVETFRDYLSLLDLGEGVQRLHSADCIYGCNLSIRRDVLFEAGGFNPDALPQELVKYRGDGETGLMNKVLRSGYQLFYNPKAVVEHVVPPERLTIDYFKRIAFRQGVSDSFTDIRAVHGLDFRDAVKPKGVLGYASGIVRACKRCIKRCLFWKVSSTNAPKYKEISEELNCSYAQGWDFHQKALSEDALLREYVLRDDYLGSNGELPR